MPKNIKADIQVGACGWLHHNWQDDYYPEDLPGDWQLAYYSNDFNCVLVPADALLPEKPLPVSQWLDEVHDRFRFFIECNTAMLDIVDLSSLIASASCLQPQLSGLVLSGDIIHSGSQPGQLVECADALGVPLYASAAVLAENTLPARPFWQPGQSLAPATAPVVELVIMEHDLRDLRSARELIEPFLSWLDNAGRPRGGKAGSTAAIFVRHEQLRVDDLVRFRAMLELMGY